MKNVKKKMTRYTLLFIKHMTKAFFEAIQIDFGLNSPSTNWKDVIYDKLPIQTILKWKEVKSQFVNEQIC